MAGETQITIVGNLTGDPELRFTPSGAAVANFTIASTPRKFDKETNEYVDGETLFLNASVWRQYAENVAETLTKGMRVIAQGTLNQRSYEDRDGNKRTVVELDVEEVGPALRYATAKVTRTASGGNGGGGNGGGGNGGGGKRNRSNDDADEQPRGRGRSRSSNDDDDEDGDDDFDDQPQRGRSSSRNGGGSGGRGKPAPRGRQSRDADDDDDF